jgi:hypothetical protein
MISLRLMKPINDDTMRESLNIFQAFLEFLKYLYLRNLFTFIALIGDFPCILEGRMDYPDGLQFQAVPFPHSSSLTN